MRILFATNEPYLPEEIGGGLIGIHNTIHELLALGHDCEVVAALAGWKQSKRKFNYLSYRLRCKLSRKLWINLKDKTNGYVTNRVSHWEVPHFFTERLSSFNPDIVITQGNGRVDLAVEAIKLGYPAIIRAVTVGCIEVIEKAVKESLEVAKLIQDQHIVISVPTQFLAKRVRELLGVESPLVYELIRFDDFRIGQRNPEFITFVNPRKIKGLEIALKVAALLPHRKFLFVESWTLDSVAQTELNIKLRSLPNIRFRPHSLSMIDVYQRTLLLLAPSQWEEVFGRVIVEAGSNGIPSVASRIGGIPEALGEGGILLSPSDPPEKWASTIENILLNKNLYADLSHKAMLSANRPELNPQNIAQNFLQVVKELILNQAELNLTKNKEKSNV
jgi:glycosyltransferase involved in cell wall biosynthesis